MEKDHDSLTEERSAVPGIVGIVAPEILPQAWPLLREYIQAALAISAQHEISIEYVEHHLFKSGEFLLLCMQDGAGVVCGGAVITKSRRQDGVPYLSVVAVGGRNLDAWLDELARACIEVAKAIGAAEIVMVARTGWKRALQQWGVRERASILSYEVK